MIILKLGVFLMFQLNHKNIISLGLILLFLITPIKIIFGMEEECFVNENNSLTSLLGGKDVTGLLIDKYIIDRSDYVGLMGLLRTSLTDSRIVRDRVRASKNKFLNKTLVARYIDKYVCLKFKLALKDNGFFDLSKFENKDFAIWNEISINPNHFFSDRQIDKNIWLITTKQQLREEIKKIINDRKDFYGIQEVIDSTPAYFENVLFYRWGGFGNDQILRYRYVAIGGVDASCSLSLGNKITSESAQWRGGIEANHANTKAHEYCFNIYIF